MTIIGNNIWRIYAMEELFIFKYKKEEIQMKSTYQYPTFKEAVEYINSLPSKDNYLSAIQAGNLKLYAKIGSKTYQPMGTLSQTLYKSLGGTT
jgi:hypothetical protein